MRAAVVQIESTSPSIVFRQAADLIAGGGVLAFPTDTLYGLGVDPRNREAIKRLFLIKGRPANQPILLLISGAAEAEKWTTGINKVAEELMDRYWPGPLTLVFTARSDIAEELTAGTGTIGLRVPGNALTRKLLHAVGGCLTGTSANRSGGPDPRSAEQVSLTLGESIDLILDGGAAATTGLPSTIVDVSMNTPALIRRGAVNLNLPK